ncbi:DUF262 domain-containing protein [Halobacterium salinarum]|nr:DUF262 domain-containing protein [Halobacterium salinarum]UEB91213.1 DUF262 domain-containing HNH endonuclease family protein [Halobacterium salinarum NRC-34001]CAP14146.1 DUF262/DUF1524 domain protein [Halobacterium salinarum R1]
MGYQSTTIASIVNDVNYNYLMPAIQREFVWDKNQILDLFDSVLRGYPIGSFLFWRVKGDYAKDRIKYEFVKNYIVDPIHPDELEDVRYHNKRYRDDINGSPNRINLVLDGQQRLTSFFIGLKGTLTTKKHNKRRSRTESWEKKQLYLNVLSPTNEEVNERRYQFEFKTPNPQHSKGEYWYKVQNILDVTDFTEESGKLISEIEEMDEINEETARGPVSKNINNLYNSIHDKEVISYFEGEEESQEKVLDIFLRANEGGTQLKKSDILLSIATAHWSREDQTNSIVAREEIQALVDKLNKHESRGTVEFDSNFVLRALMLTGEVSSLSFSLSNFTKSTLSKMKDAWMSPEFEKSLFRTLDLMKSYGFTTSHIRSKISLLPVIYYFYSNGNPTISYESKHGKENRQKILYWMCSIVTNGELTTGGTIQTIRGVRKALRESPANEFPLNEIESTLNNYNKSMGFDRENIERWFNDSSKSNRVLRVVLSLLYFPNVANENYSFEVDHIFPKSKLKSDYLVDEVGMSREEASKIEKLRDNPANLQLIRERPNRKKSDKPPAEWLPTRSDDYMQRHRIPESNELYEIENVGEFLEARKDMIISDLLNQSPDRNNISMNDQEDLI